MRKNTKNIKNKENRHNFLFVFLSFLISFFLVVTAFLLKNSKDSSRDKIKLYSKGEHFNKTKLNNFFNNLTKKYSFLSKENSSIKDCNKLNITKERILCKEYFKQKQREVLMYKPYLLFALLEHGVISAKEAIYKYQIPKEKLAEALDDPNYCFNDKKCLDSYEHFKKNYGDTTPIKENIEKAWLYYRKGLLSLENYTNPYKLNCTNSTSCRSYIVKYKKQIKDQNERIFN